MGKDWSKGREFVDRKICLTCGGRFYAPPIQVRRGGGKFCSNKCYGSSVAKQKIKRTCRKCEKPFYFDKSQGDTRVCDACKAQKIKKDVVLTACKYCGEQSEKIFCNRVCYMGFRKANIKERTLKPNAKCLKCGNAFYASPGHVKNGWGKYCSMRCRPLNRHQRSKGGIRDDIGIYVRSSWEANYARYLNFLKENGEIEKWEYEPDTFEFNGIKRGTMFYTPDFKIYENDGKIIYHEVKGYMDKTSKTKLKRMSKYHPETVIVLIMRKEMLEIKNKVGRFLNWETNINQKL